MAGDDPGAVGYFVGCFEDLGAGLAKGVENTVAFCETYFSSGPE
jgi:hypothetical protein